MTIACGNGHDITPAGDIALAIVVLAHGHHGAVGFQAYGVITACGNGIPPGDFIPQSTCLCGGVLIVAHFAKSHRRSSMIAVCLQPQSSDIPGFRNLGLAVLIFAQCLKCCCGLFVLSGGLQFHGSGIPSFLRQNRTVLIVAQCLKCCCGFFILSGCLQFHGSDIPNFLRQNRTVLIVAQFCKGLSCLFILSGSLQFHGSDIPGFRNLGLAVLIFAQCLKSSGGFFILSGGLQLHGFIIGKHGADDYRPGKDYRKHRNGGNDGNDGCLFRFLGLDSGGFRFLCRQAGPLPAFCFFLCLELRRLIQAEGLLGVRIFPARNGAQQLRGLFIAGNGSTGHFRLGVRQNPVFPFILVSGIDVRKGI